MKKQKSHLELLIRKMKKQNLDFELQALGVSLLKLNII